MLCEKCHQNYATTVITKTLNGETSTIHMCAECAFKLGYSNIFGNFSLNHIMSDFENAHQTQKVRCEKCGSGFDEILASGKLGCSACYETFKNELMPTIENIHGRAIHVGKRPHKYIEPAPQNLLDELKQKLDNAIKEQEFETAALLRDEIKKLDQAE